MGAAPIALLSNLTFAMIHSLTQATVRSVWIFAMFAVIIIHAQIAQLIMPMIQHLRNV